MGVGIAVEMPDSPSGNFGLETADFERNFIVLSNNYADGPLIVTNAIGVPRPFTPYGTATEAHLFSRVRDISAKRIQANSLYWQVTCKYALGEEEDEDEDTNPILELPEISTSFETFQEVVQGSFDSTNETPRLSNGGDGLKSSAGEVFDPLPQKDSSRLRLTIAQNEDISANHPAIAIAYIDAVNSDTFWGAAAGTAKIVAINTVKKQKKLEDETYFEYLRVNYEIAFRPTWEIELLDQGNYFISSTTAGHAASGLKMQFKTDDGNPYLGLLDGSGNALADGANAIFLAPFQIYRTKAFAALNLPQSFSAGKARRK